MIKLVRDYKAEEQAMEEYHEQQDKFVNGEIDKPPFPMTNISIYKEVEVGNEAT